MREKEGMALQSNEVMLAISVVATFVVLRILGEFMLNMTGRVLKDYLNSMGDPYEVTSEFLTRTGLDVVKYCVIIVGPVAVIIGLVVIITVMAQTRGLFSGKSIRPKFSRLSPIQGFKRLFSLQSLVNVVKGIIELVVIGAISYFQIQGRMNDFSKLPDMEPLQGVHYIATSVYDIVMLIFIVLAAVAAGDYVFQWWSYEKKLKMSKQEVKDEYKQIEGDPQIKSKIKQKQREISQRRMMQEVPTADVVVRNPTHYAVALKYESENAFSAPRVVAKGMDALALKIIKVAEENNVYITENRPLARSLYDNVQLGAEIPPEFYTAVATVLTEMFNVKGIKPVIRNTGNDQSYQMRRRRVNMGRGIHTDLRPDIQSVKESDIEPEKAPDLDKKA